MKRIISILIPLFACLPMAAQEVAADTLMALPQQVVAEPLSQPLGTALRPMTGSSISGTGVLPPEMADSLALPRLNWRGQMRPLTTYPLLSSGFYNWQLHEGLNANIGASVFAQFGKHAHHGAGFSQNVALMYAAPITDKLSFAAGGYLTNTWWAGSHYVDGGLNGVVSYRFNDRWEAYLYGQKSLMNRRMPMPLYDMSDIGDRIGAAVKYNVSPSFSIQINVEHNERRLPPLYFEPRERQTQQHPGHH